MHENKMADRRPLKCILSDSLFMFWHFLFLNLSTWYFHLSVFCHCKWQSFKIDSSYRQTFAIKNVHTRGYKKFVDLQYIWDIDWSFPYLLAIFNFLQNNFNVDLYQGTFWRRLSSVRCLLYFVRIFIMTLKPYWSWNFIFSVHLLHFFFKCYCWCHSQITAKSYNLAIF